MEKREVNLIEILYPSRIYTFDPSKGKVYRLSDMQGDGRKKVAKPAPEEKPKVQRLSRAAKYQFPPTKLTCSACKITRPVHAFHANKSRASGRDSICGVCIAEKRKQRRKAKQQGDNK
jgi:hypothetical protein